MRRATRWICAWTVAVIMILGVATAQASASDGAAAPGAPPATPTPAEPTPAPDYVETVLSDENLRSRWAFVIRRTVARSQPGSGRKVRRITTHTPDRTNELLLLLKQRRYNNGKIYVQVRLSMRGSGRKGWVRRSALGSFRTITTRMVIDRRRTRATLYKRGKRIWSARIGIGKRGTSTPRGNFYVRDKLITPNPRGAYGPYALGLSAYSSTLSDWPGGGIIGIHGTNQPRLIPGRISHGCIRVKNSKIRRLYRLMPPGTPVKIL